MKKAKRGSESYGVLQVIQTGHIDQRRDDAIQLVVFKGPIPIETARKQLSQQKYSHTYKALNSDNLPIDRGMKPDRLHWFIRNICNHESFQTKVGIVPPTLALLILIKEGKCL